MQPRRLPQERPGCDRDVQGEMHAQCTSRACVWFSEVTALCVPACGFVAHFTFRRRMAVDIVANSPAAPRVRGAPPPSALLTEAGGGAASKAVRRVHRVQLISARYKVQTTYHNDPHYLLDLELLPNLCCCNQLVLTPSRTAKAHGGGHRCSFEGCNKSAQGAKDRCKAHGGGRRCTYNNCTKSARYVVRRASSRDPPSLEGSTYPAAGLATLFVIV
jgi:hypothetical protein